jgi:cellulose synthase/poly-beta-1,6-N-acetylglucosamine synthase-like glycosyltransferase
VGWIYTVVALWAVILAAKRKLRVEEMPLVWLGILILATLRSPFLPQGYGAVPALWLLTLLAASRTPTPRALSLTLLCWAALNIVWPLDWPVDPRFLAIANLIPQTLTIILAVLALKWAPAPQAAETKRPVIEAALTPAASRGA